MDLYTDTIPAMSVAERLALVERIWDDLAASGTALPLPAWAIQESCRRRDEMVSNPSLGVSHEEMWKRIQERRNG